MNKIEKIELNDRIGRSRQEVAYRYEEEDGKNFGFIVYSDEKGYFVMMQNANAINSRVKKLDKDTIIIYLN